LFAGHDKFANSQKLLAGWPSALLGSWKYSTVRKIFL